MTSANPRQLAFVALQNVYKRQAYTDIAINRVLRQSSLERRDRSLVTELVYGIVRRKRSLDRIIDQLATKKAAKQPPDLRIVLHLGLYQLRYLDQIPAAAAVDTSVQLAKANRLGKLTGVVNGILRQYQRLATKGHDPLSLPADPVQRIGILHSFPDWIVKNWIEQIGIDAAAQLGQHFNQPSAIDLRINLLKTTLEEAETALVSAGVGVQRLVNLPQALRLKSGAGSIEELPGYKQGWWTVQDGSAQLVSYLLDPQPGEVVIDACAAPGGKTTHIAELMKDRGKIWACDRALSRLRKVQVNAERLGLNSITTLEGDSCHFDQFKETADRVLLDAPCSGLGTLGRRPDIRWRQTPQKVKELSLLQKELLETTAAWVKPGGALVYATCTLNRLENEEVIQPFLNRYPQWQIDLALSQPLTGLATASGYLKIWPHLSSMDGFFMVKLKKGFVK